MEDLVKSGGYFGGAYKGRRVLVTGHTGFKGSWLTLWLLRLGARVSGYSLYLPSKPSNFEILRLGHMVRHRTGDVCDFDRLRRTFNECRPEIVFHLAAQSVVRRSYEEPKSTFDTNSSGTVNMLECIRRSPFVKAAVIVTSDKCYKNIETNEGYREGDQLGGDEPYSASKACAELATAAYMRAFFAKDGAPAVATARAGNVIGGGDWMKDRIVPDCVRALSAGRKIRLRNPSATRPWQHVLEPISGYLWLGANLVARPDVVKAEAFNFGPGEDVVKSVRDLVALLIGYWGRGGWKHAPTKGGRREAMLLNLSCRKARKDLGWHTVLDFDDTVKFTAEWYKDYYDGSKDMFEKSCEQIDRYAERAVHWDMAWASLSRVR